VARALLTPPLNALRLTLRPDGLAPRIENLAEWREHLLQRLRRQIELTGDPELIALERECQHWPASPAARRRRCGEPAVSVPLRLRTRVGLLAFISTTLVFGAPLDVTLSEIAVELFFPADAATRAAVARLAD
jgi:hypothetical protein